MQVLPDNIEMIVNEFVNNAVELLGNHLKQIILYGSYARGDFNSNSDIDIMILVDLEDKELEKKSDEIVEMAYDIEANNDFLIHLSPLVKNIDSFNYWLDTIPFYMNVKREGVPLH